MRRLDRSEGFEGRAMRRGGLPLLLGMFVGACVFFMPHTCAASIIYVTNLISSRIEKVASNHVVTTFASTGLSGPVGIAFDHAGNLYVANNGNNTIEKFT